MKSQRDKILELLKTNDKVNSYDLTYFHSIKQAPTRVYELRQLGHQILSSAPLKNGSIDYYLDTQETLQTSLKSQPEGAKTERKPIGWDFRGNTAFPIYE